MVQYSYTKNITVRFDLPEEMLPVINADAVMINRVIRNLLGNAIQYTDPGGTITMKLFGREQTACKERGASC
jgi:signal transduction histidine kinase